MKFPKQLAALGGIALFISAVSGLVSYHFEEKAQALKDTENWTFPTATRTDGLRQCFNGDVALGERFVASFKAKSEEERSELSKEEKQGLDCIWERYHEAKAREVESLSTIGVRALFASLGFGVVAATAFVHLFIYWIVIGFVRGIAEASGKSKSKERL